MFGIWYLAVAIGMKLAGVFGDGCCAAARFCSGLVCVCVPSGYPVRTGCGHACGGQDLQTHFSCTSSASFLRFSTPQLELHLSLIHI